MFITFEGGEGTGKSTQVKLLAERFRAAGKTVVETREPGGTPEAEAVRNLLVKGEAARWTADEELLLNFAARGAHLRGLIRPAILDSKIVISDRYVDSSYVYQVVAGGARMSLFTELVKSVAPDPVPKFTFVLDIDPEVGMKRALARESAAAVRADRFEKKGKEFHDKVRMGFRQLVEMQAGRCHLVDAAGNPEDVAAKIWAIVRGA